MPTPIDPKRLPGLRAALDQFGADERASQRQLADLYGVANSRFTTLVKTRFPEFPTPERHDDKTHWYPARAAVGSMIAYMTASGAKKQAAARRHSAVMSGVDAKREEVAAAEPEHEPLSAAELNALASARTRVWKLQKDMGEHVPRVRVVEMTRAVNIFLTRWIMSLPTKLDPNGLLPAETRARLDTLSRAALLKLNEELSEFLEEDTDERAAGTVDAGTGADRNIRRRPVRRSVEALDATA